MAWTITETERVHRMKKAAWSISETIHEIILECTSDANASDYDIVSDIKGSYLYLVKIIPATGGDVPDAVFDMDLEDENNIHILDTDANPVAPTGGATYHAGSNTMGVYPPIGDHAASKVSLVCATLGNTKKANFHLFFSR